MSERHVEVVLPAKKEIVMEMQAIQFGRTWFCTVFKVDQQHQVTVLGTETGDTQAHVREWLEQEGFPTTGTLLQERNRGSLAELHYIKPHSTDLYYSVDPATGALTQVDATKFQDPVVIEQM
jgi:hypothetical protein